MNLTAKKYVQLFRTVKVTSAATVDAQGQPQSRIINVMLALDAFLIYEGEGEWFDLLHHPISRKRFAYGGRRDGTCGVFHPGNMHRLRRMRFGLPAAMHHARHTLPDRLDALPAVRAVHTALPGRRHCAVACIT